MRFHWNWWSEKGRERDENQDFAGIAYGSASLFAVLADGVFSRPESGELARNFVCRLVDRAASVSAPLNRELVLQWIKEIFLELKCSKKPKSSISFLVAYFSPQRLLFSIHAGDCRAGLIDKAKNIVWKNQVHSLATATVLLTEDELKEHPARNQLTRTFGTKRFIHPELTEIDCEYQEGAVLATDGFWATIPIEEQNDLLKKKITTYKGEDDASLLVIKWGNGIPADEYLAQNLYIREEVSQQ
jgi:serine/threonine protein phosphatase PrpC